MTARVVTFVGSTMEWGLGLGVLVGLSYYDLPILVWVKNVSLETRFGHADYEAVLVVVVGLRIVEGVCIVRFRMEVGFGLFGDRMDSGSARSIIVVSRFCRFQKSPWCKQTNPTRP